MVKRGAGSISKLLGTVYVKYLRKKFSSSENYWEERYKKGGDSGRGSYGELAEYKAEVLNDFISNHGVKSVIEFGCGDGNQLAFVQCNNYHGFDVSLDAVERCRQLFNADSSKRFDVVADYEGDKADLVVSMDVIYHLVEDFVFENYMKRLFSASEEYVAIYSSNSNTQAIPQGPHVKHRKFSDWIDSNIEGWQLVKHVRNRYPSGVNRDEGSIADFFIYEKS